MNAMQAASVAGLGAVGLWIFKVIPTNIALWVGGAAVAVLLIGAITDKSA